MIPLIVLEKSGIRTSRLGFGTSRLHYIDSSTAIQHILSSAFDLGIIHFDTAPAYGDGLAERELGKFLRISRDRFVLATKFGISPNIFADAFPRVATPIRAARALLRRGVRRPSQRPPLTKAAMRQSVEKSLGRLMTDRIDILLLHEPTSQRLQERYELLEELERLKARGLIRSFGLAGSMKEIESIVAIEPKFGEVIQTAEREWSASATVPDITFSAMAPDGQSYFTRELDSGVALGRLRCALDRRVKGVVLVSTTRPEHLRSLASAVSDSER